MTPTFRLLGAIAPLALALAACAPGASTPANAAANSAAAEPGAALAPLSIETAKGPVRFQVEVARTQDEQARGLMYRTSLPDHGGMIFPMRPPREASFWMKNTLIPLDMIFIRADGTIARIAANTVPQDLSPVSSGEPVAAVLEIVGGGAEQYGIAEGDKVAWKDK